MIASTATVNSSGLTAAGTKANGVMANSMEKAHTKLAKASKNSANGVKAEGKDGLERMVIITIRIDYILVLI